MKAAQLSTVGPAEQVVKCIEVPDPGAPGKGEVLVDLEACSINPADILMIEGNYASVPETPCALGIEGAGKVRAVGPGVSNLKAGDKVMSLGRTNWVQQIRDQAQAFIRLPDEVDLAQAAMLKVNVATAHLMLASRLFDCADEGLEMDVAVHVGTLLAVWIIGYGAVQTFSPAITGRSSGQHPDGRTAVRWGASSRWVPPIAPSPPEQQQPPGTPPLWANDAG